MLYPLKFEPIIKEKVWGGNKLESILNKNVKTIRAGESWEISGIRNEETKVENGFLRGKFLSELISEYKEAIVGHKNFERFGSQFPLLIKFIDAADDLSVQVHPGDEFAKQKHNQNGKNEIWYVVEAEPGAELVLGLNRNFTKDEYIQLVQKKEIELYLKRIKIKAGDVAYIPAGRIHAILKGVLLAEIQQTSDLTYRIYDWDRKDLNGQLRPLHNELAAQIVDLTYEENSLIDYYPKRNQLVDLINNEFFNVKIFESSENLIRKIETNDTFKILMNVKGNATIKNFGKDVCSFEKGNTILIPAILDSVEIKIEHECRFLEISL